MHGVIYVLSAHHDFPNIAATKLFLRPIFCTFSALRSVGLFRLGIAGKGGVSRSLNGGVCDPSSLCVGNSCFSDFKLCLRLDLRGDVFVFFEDCVLRDRFRWRLTLLSVVSFSKSSIQPVMVLPSVARLSSEIAMNLMIPRFAGTPRPSSIALASRDALRLFVTGCNCDPRAVMVSEYAGSKFPPKSMQHECVTVTTIESSGRW